MSDITVVVSGTTGASVSVGGGGSVGNISVANDGTVSLTVGAAINYGMPELRVEAGANVTVTTASGSFTIIGRDVPVQSVQGRAGSVVLTRGDLTAAAAVHSHGVSDIVGFTSVANVVSVAGRTGVVALSAADVSGLAPVATSGSYTSLTSIPTAFAPSTHTHSQSQITNLTFPVTQVQGRTGSVTLTITDLTAAAASHTHSQSQISNLVFPVTQVQGRTGSVTLTITDLTAAAASHTHSTSDVTGYVAPTVFSVNGRTGTVALTVTDLTAAAASHTHSYAAISHTHLTTDIVGYSAGGGASLPSQGGNVTRLLTTDGTAASWATRYAVVDQVLAAGSNVSFVKDTAAGTIQIVSAGGTAGGGSLSSASPQPLGTAAAGSSGDASRADHVHPMPNFIAGANVTIAVDGDDVTISATGGGGGGTQLAATSSRQYTSFDSIDTDSGVVA